MQSNRKINIHKDTRMKGRRSWKTLYAKRYIYANKVCLWYFTSSTFMVQVMHQYNYPQGGIKIMQDWYLSSIQTKWTRDCNFHCISRWHAGNRRQTRICGYDWMHQERICDFINGWTRGLRRVYDQVRPHQDDPHNLSTRSTYQDDSRI